jgi:hypothetical protein
MMVNLKPKPGPTFPVRPGSPLEIGADPAALTAVQFS